MPAGHAPVGFSSVVSPGGSAPLFSTVLMLATLPARIAGCKKVVLCSPPPLR
ncbi:histidinol dehydrogenase [Shigella flexneri]